ncbi:MAG: biotin--[acetyl-CoA-carboxylase] ligase [Clostridiales bacterium]|nr:biotin--[acetyl-CoA-carboxylase] ligase [Clostridiales bacterium]
MSATDENVVWFDQLDSTNNKAKELALRGAAHGVTVAARQQTGGRGTRGRTFYSPQGGLYMSVILRDGVSHIANHDTFTYRMAQRVAEIISRAAEKHIAVKPVNDLIYKNKKVGGLLAESRCVNGKPEWIVLGIGVNVAIPDFPPALQEIAGSLYDRDHIHDHDRFDMIQALAKQLTSALLS